MTDLDVYFWRFFATGAGFAIAWRAYPWMALMGRAARHWFTMPEESRHIYDMMLNMFNEWDQHPRWYRHYVAWREVGHLT